MYELKWHRSHQFITWFKFVCVILEHLIVSGAKFMIIQHEVLSFAFAMELMDITIDNHLYLFNSWQMNVCCLILFSRHHAGFYSPEVLFIFWYKIVFMLFWMQTLTYSLCNACHLREIQIGIWRGRTDPRLTVNATTVYSKGESTVRSI